MRHKEGVCKTEGIDGEVLLNGQGVIVDVFGDVVFGGHLCTDEDAVGLPVDESEGDVVVFAFHKGGELFGVEIGDVDFDVVGAGFGGRVGLGTAFLFLLLLQGLNHTVDGRIARRLVHTGQGLQTVLQVHGGGVRHEFVEHLGAAHRFLVALALLVEQADGLSVATLRLVKPPLVPIYFAETQHQHTFLYAPARAFGTPFLVSGDGLHRVGELHIDIA